MWRVVRWTAFGTVIACALASVFVGTRLAQLDDAEQELRSYLGPRVPHGERLPVRGDGRSGNACLAYGLATLVARTERPTVPLVWDSRVGHVVLTTRDEAPRPHAGVDSVLQLIGQGAESTFFDMRPPGLSWRHWEPFTCGRWGISDALERGQTRDALEVTLDLTWFVLDRVRVGEGMVCWTEEADHWSGIHRIWIYRGHGVHRFHEWPAMIAHIVSLDPTLAPNAATALARADASYPQVEQGLARFASRELREVKRNWSVAVSPDWPASWNAARDRARRALFHPRLVWTANRWTADRLRVLRALDRPWTELGPIIAALRTRDPMDHLPGAASTWLPRTRLAKCVTEHRATLARLRLLRALCGVDPSTLQDPFAPTGVGLRSRAERNFNVYWSRGPDGEDDGGRPGHRWPRNGFHRGDDLVLVGPN